MTKKGKLPPDMQERRNYALLQAAATLTVGQNFDKPLSAVEGSRWFEFAVAQARVLLAEIEEVEGK